MKLLNQQEFAELLGRSRDWLQKAIHKGIAPPGKKIGNHRYWLESDLLEWYNNLKEGK